MNSKLSKALVALALIAFGAGAAIGFQSISKTQPNCEEIVRDGRVPDANESRIQLSLRYTFAIATFRWLDPASQTSMLEQARIAEAKYPDESAGLDVQKGDLLIGNFAKLTPEFQWALLESMGQGLRVGKSAETKADRSLVYDFAQEASILAKSNAKCFPLFRFERR
jgi:hypothetical protein